jgi:hypothetical protein
MLGGFGVLVVAAIVLSLSTAPANPGDQLRTAAADTAGASSFVLTDTEQAGPLSSSRSSSQQAVIVYQAPDRVEETVTGGAQSGTVLVVGTHRYERSGGAKWVDLGSVKPSSTGGVSAGRLAASDILFPMQSLSSASKVSVLHDVYRFVPGQPALLLTRLLGTNLPAGTTTYTATVNGEFVGMEKVTVTTDGERVTVALDLSHVDKAPTLQEPPSSQVTTVPSGSR